MNKNVSTTISGNVVFSIKRASRTFPQKYVILFVAKYHLGNSKLKPGAGQRSNYQSLQSFIASLHFAR